MSERYPGYDVLAKRDTPSWNEQTAEVIDQRLAIDPERHAFFSDLEWPTLKAICARIAPQPPTRAMQAPLAAMVDEKMAENSGDGFRHADLPPMQEAWRIGVAAIESEALALHGQSFVALDGERQDAVLRHVQSLDGGGPAWKGMPPKRFFEARLLPDIVKSYYAHPVAWNEIGFGGPASPRGYVRMNYDRRDPWEAAEARPGHEEEARRENARIA